ncbi:MAG: hypothetical protein ABEJ66_00990 [Candidatus Nanohaloarchaea archaeon]
MDRVKLSKLVLAGVIAGSAGYLASLRAGIIPAVTVLFTSALVLYLVSSKKRAWSSLEMLTEPFWNFVLFSLAGFSYFTLEGNSTTESVVFGAGAGLIGGAVAMFLHKYWNMG